MRVRNKVKKKLNELTFFIYRLQSIWVSDVYNKTRTIKLSQMNVDSASSTLRRRRIPQ